MKGVFVACICMMLLCVMLTGCEELLETKPNYITVTVSIQARAVDQYTTDGRVVGTSPITGKQVQLRIQKDQGEQSTWEVITDGNGYTPVKTASFNVYNQQRIDASARPQGFKADRDSRIFLWVELWLLAGEEFGKSISVSAHDLILANTIEQYTYEPEPW